MIEENSHTAYYPPTSLSIKAASRQQTSFKRMESKRQKMSTASSEEDAISDISVPSPPAAPAPSPQPDVAAASTSAKDDTEDEPEEPQEPTPVVNNVLHNPDIEVLLSKLCPTYVPLRDLPINRPIKIANFTKVELNNEIKLSVTFEDGRKIILPDRYSTNLIDKELEALNTFSNLYFIYEGLHPIRGTGRTYHQLKIYNK